MSKLRTLSLTIVLILSLAWTLPVTTFPVSASTSTQDYNAVVKAVDMDAIRGHIQYFSSLGTRALGYPGSTLAAQYVYDRFTDIGLSNVQFLNFTAVDAFSYGANLTILSSEAGGRKSIDVYPIVPNLVSPSTYPSGGVKGKLIYAGEGYLADFNGKDVEGSIVLMNFNTMDRWVNAFSLGAQAVIFLPSTRSIPGEHEYKHLLLPIHFPRFTLKPADGEALLKLLDKGPVQVHLESMVRWENLRGSDVLGFLTGTTYPDQYVVLSSYYDSYSVAPSLAPGAQEACGVSALIEVAKYFKAHPPAYSVVFAAFGGHHQDLAGAQAFRKEYIFPGQSWEALGKKLILHLNLDFSTGSDIVFFTWYGGNHIGMTTGTDYSAYDKMLLLHKQVHELINVQKPGGRTYTAYNERMGMMFPWTMPTNTMWPWYDSEVMYFILFPAFTFTTTFDPRPYHNTPLDTVDRIDFTNLETQVQYVLCTLATFLNTDGLKETYLKGFEYQKTHDLGQNSRTVYGRLVRYSQAINWYEPIPRLDGTVTLVLSRLGGEMRTRGHGEQDVLITAHRLQVEIAGEDGYFAFEDQNTYLHIYQLSAWVVDVTTGKVLYALDKGQFMYPHRAVYEGAAGLSEVGSLGWIPYEPASGVDLSYVTLFECGSLILAENADPWSLYAYGVSWRILDQYTYGVATSYMVSLPISPSGVALTYPTEFPYLTMLFLPTKGKYILLPAERYPRTMLLEGYSMEAGQQILLKHVDLQYAKNIYELNDARVKTLLDYQMAKGDVVKAHTEAANYITMAESALSNRLYDKAFTYAFNALRLQAEVYTSTRNIIQDAAYTVPFFAFLLVPFTFLFEKLVFSLGRVRRAAAFLIIFAVIFGTLLALHPGFSFANAPIMVVIGSSILIVISPILVIMAGHIQSLFNILREKYLGSHFTELSRASAAVTSFLVGVENMRKRKARSALALISIILMVSSMIGFTSIQAVSVTTTASRSEKGLYDGLYLRYDSWGGLSPKLMDYLKARYGDAIVTCPRAWFYTVQKSVYPQFSFKVAYQNKSVQAYALLGLTPQEIQFSKLDQFVEGRWFEPGDSEAVILSQTQAKYLGITSLPATVSMTGVDYNVIGIIDDMYALTVQDLDGEEFTPLQLNIPNPEMNIHCTADMVIIIAYQESMPLESISVMFKDPSQIQTVAQEISKLLGASYIYVYASQNDVISLYTEASRVSFFGLNYQLIPMALVILVIFNLMLGAVVERVNDIRIYSCIGLSPLHVAFMFLAEAIVYAVIGGLFGYVAAMLLAKAGNLWFPGILFLNYSSNWAVTGIGVSMLIVIVSSLYPMFMSTRLVTPSMERAWKIPTKPIVDQWTIPLPFIVTTQELYGVLAYLEEFIRPHVAERADLFSVKALGFNEGTIEGKDVKQLIVEGTLTPYEKGIHQTTYIMFTLSPEEAKWHVQLRAIRTMGIRDAWVTANRNFVDILRKQLLLWNTLSPSKRESYVQRFPEVKERLITKTT